MSEQNFGAANAEQDDVGGLLTAGRVAGRWVIDPSASTIEFHVKHF